jgi:uncharacterized protein (DUF305 family)
MKKIVGALSLVILFMACNNDTTEGNTAKNDTTDHAMHGAEGNHTPAASDTAAFGGQSMMSIMENNMNQMKAIPTTGNPDNDFAAMMKVHHMGAIEMAQLELAKGTDPQLKQMAQKMLDAQQREVAEFNTFLSGHTAHGGGDAFHKEVVAGMNNMKMDMDHSGSIDKQFAQMMIPHHQGGIDMARAYIKSGAHEEKLKTMANAIIADQQKEIKELQAWLAKNK